MDEFDDITQVSAQHPQVKQYVRLKNNNQSHADNSVAIEGVWALSKAHGAKTPFEVLFVCPEIIYSEESKQLVQKCLADNVNCVIVSRRVMERMVDRDKPDGLAAIVKLPNTSLDDITVSTKSRILVLDALEIPGNVGTIIRCADATGVSAVILTNARTRVTHPKVVHGSMGSVFSLPTVVAETQEVVDWLKSNKFTIATASTEGTQSYRKADYSDKCALVMGSERFGLSKEWHNNEDIGVNIPMLGVSDSLNVGLAAALLMYEVLHSHEPQLF